MKTKKLNILLISMIFITLIVTTGYFVRYFQYNNLINEKNNLENTLLLYKKEKFNLEDKIILTEKNIELQDNFISDIQESINLRKLNIINLDNQIEYYEKLKKYDMTVFITPDNKKVKFLADTMQTNDPILIYRYVRDQIRYVEDYTTHDYRFEYWQLPEETLTLGTGDCEDQAILLCTLLRAKGYSSEDVKVVFGLTSATSGHAWVELLYQGDWVVFDPTSSASNYIEKTKYYSLVNITYKGSFNDVFYEVIE